VAVNIARVMQVRATMGMLPFDSASAKGLVAALGALVGALAVAATVPGRLALWLGVPVTLAIYVAMLVLLRLPSDDYILLQQMTRRGGTGPSHPEVSDRALMSAGRS
jgi:hypothetical protein